MESKLAKRAEHELIEATQRLAPEQRLNAMLAHSRLMAKLMQLGRRTRQPPFESRA